MEIAEVENWKEHIRVDHEEIQRLQKQIVRMEAQIEVAKGVIEEYKDLNERLQTSSTDEFLRFRLRRDVDVSGLSGTGIVAEGVQFPDGTCVVRWREVTGEHYERGVRATTVMFPNARAVMALHGHNGATKLEWIDG